MRRLMMSFVLLLFCACRSAGPSTQPAIATERAATTTTPSMVSFPSSDGPATGYLALPKAPAGAAVPAIIVIHEWWGLNDWVREATRRFADEGYVALAVDLYRGRVATDASEAHELSRGLPEDRALGDLNAALRYLSQRPDVDAKRIGVIGWCMGGGYSLAFAASQPALQAAVINYGRLISDPHAIAAIHPSILGNFGEADRGIAADDVRKFAAALSEAGVESDIKLYPGAGHAFMNPDNEKGYDAAAAADAWKRIDEFFARELRGGR